MPSGVRMPTVVVIADPMVSTSKKGLARVQTKTGVAPGPRSKGWPSGRGRRSGRRSSPRGHQGQEPEQHEAGGARALLLLQVGGDGRVVRVVDRGVDLGEQAQQPAGG